MEAIRKNKIRKAKIIFILYTSVTKIILGNRRIKMKTEVVNGAENVIDTELKFFFKTQKTIDTCMNYTRPPLAITIEPIKKAFLDAKNRGVRLRYLTEITKDNISYCKQLMEITHEFRH